MRPYQLDLSVGACIALLIVAVSFPWAHQVVARSAAADFSPAYIPSEAASDVAVARVGEAQQRRNALQITTDKLPLAPTIFFPQTGHHLSNRAGFLNFWRANGQVVIFGYPITEEIVEDGRIVQYFERARFEYHSEADAASQVQLGLLGREMMAGLDIAGIPDPQTRARYFPETRHSLSGEFQSYWERRGGLPLFGYPLREQLEENGRVVQYFERARLEYEPEDMAAFYRQMEQANGISLNTLHEVVVSDSGRQVAQARGINIAPVATLIGAAAWSPALWGRRMTVNLSTQWLTAYEDDLIVYRAPVATGRDGFNTPTGSFAIYERLPLQTMVGSASGESWYVPDVPWVQYIVDGVALHGTYWHNQFGSGYRLSHGCINLSMDDAEWLYIWADTGTSVSIHN